MLTAAGMVNIAVSPAMANMPKRSVPVQKLGQVSCQKKTATPAPSRPPAPMPTPRVANERFHHAVGVPGGPSSPPSGGGSARGVPGGESGRRWGSGPGCGGGGPSGAESSGGGETGGGGASTGATPLGGGGGGTSSTWARNSVRTTAPANKRVLP